MAGNRLCAQRGAIGPWPGRANGPPRPCQGTLDIRPPVPGWPVFSGLLRYTVIATGFRRALARPDGRGSRAPRRRLGSDAVPIYALDYAAPSIDPQAYVHPDAVVIGAVELAAGASVWPGAVLRGDHGVIRVGERTSIQDGTVVHTTEEWPTLIGADCVVGHRAHLEGCVVEDGCLIGSGSLVLNRARVAAGAVVAAAALVREDMVVPAGALALGVPARIRAGAGQAQQEWIKYAVQTYLDLAERHRSGLRRLDAPAAGD